MTKPQKIKIVQGETFFYVSSQRLKTIDEHFNLALDDLNEKNIYAASQHLLQGSHIVKWILTHPNQQKL